MDYPEQFDEGDTHASTLEQINFFEIDPNWISLQTIQEWRKTCNKKHDCRNYPLLGEPPAWLIDVIDNRLVSTEGLSNPPTYCALSYVWGKVITAKLTRATQQTFCQGGAFSEENSAVLIPKTIRHAMKLVERLGLEYLWVDALCIVQDDDGHFHSELRNMGAIYNNALLTIVAATGYTADDGLKGLRGISASRQLATNHADDLHKYLNPEHMVWNSRGWTFQEGQLSRRMIMFCGQTVMWKCIHGALDEAGRVVSLPGKGTAGVRSLRQSSPHATTPRPDNHDNRPGETSTLTVWNKIQTNTRSVITKVLPNLKVKQTNTSAQEDQFATFVEEAVQPLNTRRFTDTVDLPPAFEGIAHFLSQDSPPDSIYFKGFCWGLPLAHFPYALTWTTDGEDLRPRDRTLGFPSWSWLAWEGKVAGDKPSLPADAPFTGISWIGEAQPEQAICEWEIALGPVSERAASSFHGGYPRQIRLVAQYCVACPTSQATLVSVTSSDRPFHWISMDKHHPAWLLANRPSELRVTDGLNVGNMELVGISEFEALISRFEERFGSSKKYKNPSRASFIKALWVVRLDIESSSDGAENRSTEPCFRRLGVAIVEKGLWNLNVRQGGLLGGGRVPILLE